MHWPAASLAFLAAVPGLRHFRFVGLLRWAGNSPPDWADLCPRYARPWGWSANRLYAWRASELFTDAAKTVATPPIPA